ncbi:MAG TPA: wax ester/triacylglycerol synthase family O-acyltransferase, partial [Candidatus Acidoferrum sp.]|nr:wax ester/triacylglycerol synthase family O-acyltransferase [Candidatus Acidoferrum sp.]
HRLNALEAAFVKLDEAGAPFRVGAVLVFERGPLATQSGELDTARLRQFIASAVDHLPRYRQRIHRIPILGHPVWLDCERLDLDDHVRFARLRPPGREAELNELAGRVFSSPLPLDRPPWQFWFVDGLAGDRFAEIVYIHHALVDGISGVRLLEALLRPVPDARVSPRAPWHPDRASTSALIKGELGHRLRGLAAIHRSLPGPAGELVPALADLLVRGLRPASDAGLNRGRVGSERIVAGWQVPMADIAQVRRRFGATVNDVVLASVAGALRRFLIRRGVDVSTLSDFRAMVPASTHEASDTSVSGNRVAMLLAQLPLDQPEPARRMERVRATTSALKRASHHVAAGELLLRVCDVSAPSLLPALMNLSLARRAFNVVITDIPGPRVPLYLLGCRLQSFHPIVNLWPQHTLGLAFFSYAGTMYCGLHADRDAIADLDPLVGDLEASFAELRDAARPADVAPAEAAASPALATA